ncbi:CopG family ribbon-helix-helix protein [Kordiimonas sp.]|uniref:CopG family ribbon-helix-helix protein n=1 Tax=Kordiimonas sp. TaxID=1970157 RepID=UPI003A8DDEE9
MSSGSQRLEIRIDDSLLGEVDAWRAEASISPSRSEAVRMLIAKGLGGESAKSFELMRTKVLSMSLNPHTEKLVSDAYVYAWQYRLFPFQESSETEDVFKDDFDIKEEEILDLVKYLDRLWMRKEVPTFYELEDYYGVSSYTTSGWTRFKLIVCCRYLYLHNSFDTAFWNKLISPMEHPAEASIINEQMDREKDIYL